MILRKLQIILIIIIIGVVIILNIGIFTKAPVKEFISMKDLSHPDKDEIKEIINSWYADVDFELKHNIQQSNKFEIVAGDSILGYVYVVIMPVRNPLYSHVNYLLVLGKDYSIHELIFHKTVIEENRVIPEVEMSQLENLVKDKNLLNYNFDEIDQSKLPNEYSKFVLQSLNELQQKEREHLN